MQADLSLFDVEITSGYSYQAFEYDNTSSNYKEILNPDGTVNEDNSVTQSFIDKSKNVLISYFGRANFNLLLTMTLRADASSKLNQRIDGDTFHHLSYGISIMKTLLDQM